MDIEQLKKITNNAPAGATKYAKHIDVVYFKNVVPQGLKLFNPIMNRWDWVSDISWVRNMKDLSDLHTIIAQHEELTQLSKQLKHLWDLIGVKSQIQAIIKLQKLLKLENY